MTNHVRNGLVAVIAVLVLATGAVPALAADVNVVVDGQVLTFDEPPTMQGGRVLVPLRGIFERLGADVVFSAATRDIKATRGSTVIELTLGSNNALVNGRNVYLDSPAQAFGGRTMVPLRFISEALGADVKWNAATRTVQIASTTMPPSGGTTPPPSSGTTPPPTAERPRIDNIVMNADSTLEPGDTLTVIMTGTPNGRASFDLLGIASDISMREVSGGRYEGSFTIRRDTRQGRATVVVHLSKDGTEAMQEASRTVAIGPSAPTGGIPPYPTTGGALTLSPLPNSISAVTRPTIAATFASNINAGSLRLLLDGQDVTGRANVGFRDIFFTPENDLGIGVHTVQIYGTAAAGTPLNRTWSFSVPQNAVSGSGIQSVTVTPSVLQVGQTITVTAQGLSGGYATMDVAGRTGIAMREVSPGTYLGYFTPTGSEDAQSRVIVNLRLPNGMVVSAPSQTLLGGGYYPGGTYPGGTGSLFVTVTSPRAGDNVGGTFNVEGQTNAYATVDVQATVRRALIPGIIDVQSRTVHTRVQADASGHYVAPINVGSVSNNNTIGLQVRAMDNLGNTSQTVQFDIAVGD